MTSAGPISVVIAFALVASTAGTLLGAHDPSPIEYLRCDHLQLGIDRHALRIVEMDMGGRAVSVSAHEMWSLTVVDSNLSVTYDGSWARARRFTRSANMALMRWKDIDGRGIDVQITMTASQDAISVEFDVLARDYTGPGAIAIWDIQFIIGAFPRARSVLFPHGFGLVVEDRTRMAQMSGTYPSGDCTMQFMAIELDDPDPHPHRHHLYSALYFGTHDSLASSKTMRTIASANGSVAMGVSYWPSVQGRALHGRTVTVPFQWVLMPVHDYWHAAHLYRTRFVEGHAWWIGRGPMQTRGDVPDWLLAQHIWINTGWQQYDVFDDQQGDPEVVVAHAMAMRRLFQADLALHWYEWHARHKFDTGYPEYMPAKDGFRSAVERLQHAGIRVFPYINGRIFDIGIDKWQTDHARQWAAKSAPHRPDPDPSSLSIYRESYGSGAAFAVMCPSTSYWQETIAGVVGDLVGPQAGVDGLYIDQIAAAAAVPCFDGTHGHSDIGGGPQWVHGYTAMLDQCAQHQAPIVTESNAEPYIGGVHGMLTLQVGHIASV